VSASHSVAAKDVWIGIVSTIVETSVPEREILPGLQLLGSVVDK
jgi:Rab GDP dissociation inhibitor